MTDQIPSFFKPKSNSNNAQNKLSSRQQQNIDQHIEAVIGTNDDAASCKLSTVSIGYYKDEFVKYFVKTPIRRPPLINRGFFSRVEAIEQFVKQFFSIYSSSEKPLQIVSLGCGFDTLYFRLKSRGINNMIYYEVDYSKVIANKLKIIKSTKELNSMIGSNQRWDDESHTLLTSDYRLAPIDLKAGREAFDTVFNKLEIDYDAPTMFLSECVIIYIPAESGNTLIQWASDRFKDASFITYEQIKPYDEFGTMMIKNIENKGCPLLSINSFPEIKDQRERYINLGWKRVDVLDMLDVYNYFIEKERLKETERLEIFDEFEEWNLIQGHYCYVLAIKSNDQDKIKAYSFEDKKPLNLKTSSSNISKFFG